MTKKKPLAILLTAAGLIGPVAAMAAPVTYDFAGTGKVCTYSGTGTVGTCVEGKAFTGTMVVDLLSSGPAGTDGHTDGSTYASDLSGWGDSDFTINWEDTSFNPEAGANVHWNWHDTQVLNNYSYGLIDGMINGEQYEMSDPDGTWYTESAGLYRYSYDTTWLNDLSFDTALTLAPGASAINRVYFTNKSSNNNNWLGYDGEINLTSLTVRPAAAVPEPGTLALLTAGMAAIGFVRRRRNAV